MRTMLGVSLAAALVTAGLAVAPVAHASEDADALGNTQTFRAQASPARPGEGIVFDLEQTYDNRVRAVPLRSPTEVVIHFPRGVVWNGPVFPQCDPGQLRSRGPSACPAGSRFATAEVLAAAGVAPLTHRAHVTEFVGPALDGDPTQLLYVETPIAPPFVLTGVVRDEPQGPYGPALHVDLRDLPGGTAATPSPIVITSLRNIDIHTYVEREVDGRTRRIPLIVAPPTCTGRWYYAIDSVFPAGPPIRSTSSQVCG